MRLPVRIDRHMFGGETVVKLRRIPSGKIWDQSIVVRNWGFQNRIQVTKDKEMAYGTHGDRRSLPVQGLECRVQGSVFRVQGTRLRLQGVGFLA